MATKPKKVIVRTYQVGFGDCFLLSFVYATVEKHVLIDFGTMGFKPKGEKEIIAEPSKQMVKVANDIKARCDGQLDIVVATHRHADHVSGFNTKSDKSGSGDIIRSCKPKMIIQPWTENPDLAEDAKSSKDRISSPNVTPLMLAKSRVNSLQNMGVAAANIAVEASSLLDSARSGSGVHTAVADQILFLAQNAEPLAASSKKKTGVKKEISNASAVQNLNSMSKNRHYVEYGYKGLKLSSILPGVKVTVLGPPTIEQYSKVTGHRADDEEEFWMLYAATSDTSAELLDTQAPLFPDMTVYDDDSGPEHARWFVRNLRMLRSEQLLQIARSMDKATNNTSVILLFEVGKEKLLFPGDAQIENWEWALKHDKKHQANLGLLKGTTFYKVGHHGSRNATPRTLWNHFANRKSEQPDKVAKMRSLNSTMAGKHGTKVETAVPRQSLVDALKDDTDYFTSQDVVTTGAADPDEPQFTRIEPDLWGEIEIEIK